MSYSKPHSDRPKKKVIPKPKTELQQFALFFDKDWDLRHADFAAAAAAYVTRLAPGRKADLKYEVTFFLNAGGRSAGIKKRWIDLGALTWPDDLDIREGLSAFAATL